MKRCFKCQKLKPLSAFYRHPEMTDGHLGKCKICTKADVKQRYYDPESRPRIIAYERERSQRPERKKLVLIYQRRRRALSPGKARARDAIAQGLRAGRIKREPCQVCGSPHSQAHHVDYRRPLKVIWLCFKHHREAHGQHTEPS